MAVAGAIICSVVTAVCANRAVEAVTLGGDGFVEGITAITSINLMTSVGAPRVDSDYIIVMIDLVDRCFICHF